LKRIISLIRPVLEELARVRPFRLIAIIGYTVKGIACSRTSSETVAYGGPIEWRLMRGVIVLDLCPFAQTVENSTRGR